LYCLWSSSLNLPASGQIYMEIFIFLKKKILLTSKSVFIIFFFWEFQSFLMLINFFSRNSETSKYPKKNKKKKCTQLNLIKFLAWCIQKTNEKNNFCCWLWWEKLISFIPEDRFFQCICGVGKVIDLLTHINKHIPCLGLIPQIGRPISRIVVPLVHFCLLNILVSVVICVWFFSNSSTVTIAWVFKTFN
jgi:hypothetical protein